MGVLLGAMSCYSYTKIDNVFVVHTIKLFCLFFKHILYIVEV